MKIAKDGRKMAPDGLKMASRWPQMASNWPPDGPRIASKWPQDATMDTRAKNNGLPHTRFLFFCYKSSALSIPALCGPWMLENHEPFRGQRCPDFDSAPAGVDTRSVIICVP